MSIRRRWPLAGLALLAACAAEGREKQQGPADTTVADVGVTDASRASDDTSTATDTAADTEVAVDLGEPQCVDEDGDSQTSASCGGTDCCDSGTEGTLGCNAATAAQIHGLGAEDWQVEAVAVADADPTIAITGDGTIHLVAESRDTFWHTTNEGGGWGPSAEIPFEGTSHLISHAPDGTVYVSYRTNPSLSIASTYKLMRRPPGGEWTQLDWPGEAWYPSLIVDESGAVHVLNAERIGEATTSGTRWRPRYVSYHTNASGSVVSRDVPGGNDLVHPHLALVNGVPHVAMADGRISWIARLDGETWTRFETELGQPSLIAGGALLHLFWRSDPPRWLVFDGESFAERAIAHAPGTAVEVAPDGSVWTCAITEVQGQRVVAIGAVDQPALEVVSRLPASWCRVLFDNTGAAHVFWPGISADRQQPLIFHAQRSLSPGVDQDCDGGD